MRVDEGLRPEKLDNDEILGFYGNLKKLDEYLFSTFRTRREYICM
jgi:hypothetical protein